MVVAIKSKEEFDAKLKDAGNKLVVVDFFATWCGPCKMIAPKVEVMSNEMTDVVFLKVDVDENEEIATEYKVSAMPTFMFFKDGKKIDEFAGANENKLKELIAKHK